ncbi:MAG: DUF2155 domain-containing protein [Proteobacteria bacterium]|nr:DUF2155 domain-containing protein [Pseudomonadota bacterium]
MSRLSFPLGLLAVAVAASAPALAQFGSIFGDPPRPPSEVPARPPLNSPRPPQLDQPPTVRLPPGPPPSAGVQSQPLPPPPGGASAPAQADPRQGALPRPPSQPSQQGQTPLSGLPPGQRQPRGTPQPADTAPQQGDEVIAETPSQKINNPRAVFSGLDKITGRIIAFDAAVDETVQFGALQVTPRVCYTRPPTETQLTDAFVEVDEVTLQGEVKRIFTGWMFAASPGLNAVEHPIYDVWLTDCKGGTVPQTASAAPAAAAPDAAPAPRRPPRPRARPPQSLPDTLGPPPGTFSGQPEPRR